VKNGAILVWLLFVLLAGPVIALIWTQIVPQYQARAEVRVRPIIPRLVFNTEDNGMIPLYDSFVNTQVSLIRSPTVLQRVLDQSVVQDTQWYKNTPRTLLRRLRGNQIPPIERLRESLSVRPRPRTEIIDISFVDPSSKEAKIIVDAVLEQYIRYTALKSDATRDDIFQKLTQQKTELTNAIAYKERGIAALRKSLGGNSAGELISTRRLRIDETQARLRELRQSITLLEWETSRSGVADDNDVEQQVGPLSLKHRLARARQEEQLLLTNLAAQQVEFDRLFADAQMLEKENRELDRKRALLDAIQTRIEHKDMERNVGGAIEVLTSAFAPSKPYHDRRILYTALTLGLGLVAVGVASLLGRRKHLSSTGPALVPTA